MNAHCFSIRSRCKRQYKIALMVLAIASFSFYKIVPNALANDTNYFKLNESSKLITGNKAYVNGRLFYTLKKDETVADIAKYQGISLASIWTLNQDQFASQDEMMKAHSGQQIILPLKKLPIERDNLPTLAATPAAAEASYAAGHIDKSKASEDENTGALFAAEHSAAIGNQLQSFNNGNVKNAAVDMVSSQATSQVQSWLEHYGTAELNLQSGNNFDGSSLDFLMSLYDTDKMIAFSQIGGRYIDSRFTGNLGAGQRFFLSGNMLGYNIFIDRDFSGSNTRLGIGAEYWRDYFKSSANGYFRLTNWRQSYEKTDYDERPANGFDVRFNGYLPSWPALGAKLMYEQYYGDNVALFNANKLQSNPGTLTLGLNYTPIPLITMGVDYRHGTGNENDLLYSLQLRYQLGKPWSQQIEPEYVDTLRTLAGSRYDLVQRNNNIILEYKKQDVISLSIARGISGEEKSTQKIQLSVQSKHALERIVWDDSSLRSKGGEIKHGSSKDPQDYDAVMPNYSPGGKNVYQVTARAYDRNGNASNSALLTITVTQNGHIDITEVTSFTPDKTSAKADNADLITYTATVTKGGIAQSSIPVSFNIVSGTATLGATSGNTDAQGKVTVTLKSAIPGQVIVSAKTAEMASPLDASSVIFADPSLATITAIDVDKTSALANGVDKITYTVSVMKNSAPLANEKVTFTTNLGTLSQTTVTTNAYGKASVSLTSPVTGNAVVRAHTSEVSSPVNAPAVEFMEQYAFSSITVDKTFVTANGTDKATYTVILTKNGVPATNEVVTFSTTFGTLNQQTVTTDNAGKAIVTLSATIAGKAIVKATSNKVSEQAPEVEFIASLVIDNNVEVIGTGVSGAIPKNWLQYGQLQLKANGGKGSYQWSSSNTSVASVDASTGKITLNDKGSATITVRASDGQTATYTINAPDSLVTADTTSRVTYSAAIAACAAAGGSLPSSQSYLASIYNSWGSAKAYEHYTGKTTITAWVQQSAAETPTGTTSTDDLARRNPLSNVSTTTASAFAVCVK